ncbi:MAG: aldose 1-epimerase family protein [Clostridia bacterium]|nr:aldose 1-epimerase family protein [Clostridia bacterium]
MITLKNEAMTVTIKEEGAEMTSVLAANGVEYLWHGDPKFWGKHAPVLFPICSGLINDEYHYEGKTYSLPKHGYAWTKLFEVESATETEATFLLRDDEESRKMFPFAYELRITYRLNGDTIEVAYDVTNPAEKPLYMSIGAHEAYSCPEGINAYEIVFPEAETLYTIPAPRERDDKILMLNNNKVFPLREEDFINDSLNFRDGTKSNSLVLRHKETGRGVEVRYEGFDHLLLWQPYKAPFLCVEPWCGFPDVVGHDGDITKKVGIHCVKAGETFHRLHTITLLY